MPADALMRGYTAAQRIIDSFGTNTTPVPLNGKG
jgi:hypothetical protein